MVAFANTLRVRLAISPIPPYTAPSPPFASHFAASRRHAAILHAISLYFFTSLPHFRWFAVRAIFLRHTVYASNSALLIDTQDVRYNVVCRRFGYEQNNATLLRRATMGFAFATPRCR